MPCLPNETWLAPDDEYSVSSGDSVFCCQRKTIIQRYISSQLQQHGLFEVCKDCRTTQLRTYLDYAERGTRWLWGGKLIEGPHVGAGVLVFADVNGDNAFHMQRIRDIQENSKPLQELPADVKRAEKMLIEHYRARETMKAGNRRTGHDGAQQSPPIKPLTDSEVLRNILRHGGYISWDIVDLVVRLQNLGGKKAMLTVLSGQSYVQYPRPVMLFIGGVRDMLSTPQKSNTGVVCAYDFIKDAVIMKTYDGGNLDHPLARSWYHSDTEGGFFLSRDPKEFLDALIDTKRDGLFFAAGRPDAGDVWKWLNIIAASLAGGWLTMHGAALDVPDTTLQPLSYWLALLKTDMKFTELPNYAANRAHIIDELDPISTEIRIKAERGPQSATEDDVMTEVDDLGEQFDQLLPGLVQVLKVSQRPLE